MTERGRRVGWWSRGRVRTARMEVTLVLIGVTVLSLVLVGLFDYFSARRMLGETVENELIDIGAARAARFDAGFQAIEGTVTSVAGDSGVVDALLDLSAGYVDLEVPDRAGFLQDLYIDQNPFPAGERAGLADADDGSAYSRAHAEHHPTLRALAEMNLFGDLVLVDRTSAHVVYTVDKRADFATDLASGPFRGSALADAVVDQLGSAVPAEAVVVDCESYEPADGTPVMFISVPVRSEDVVVGALAVEITIDVLDSITTADHDWEGTGLGATGEIYLVGPDRRMRSDSRLWLEDPAGFRRAVTAAGQSEEVTGEVDTFGTTALIQPVDTEAVAVALGGDTFVGRTVNYLGRDTLTVATPFDTGNLGWVMVAERTTAEAEESIADFRRRALLLAALLVPLVAVLGVLLTRRLLRPIGPITAAARAAGQGDLEVSLAEDGGDEFGELSRRFNAMVAASRRQEARLAQVDAEATELLAAVLPAHLVERVKRGDVGVAEVLRDATVVALAVDEPDSAASIDDEVLRDLWVEISSEMTALAERHGVDPLHTSASQLLFAAGLRSAGTEAADAVAFAMEALTALVRRGERSGVALNVHAGLAAGDVVAAVVDTERLSFDVWGEPVRIARALLDRAGPGEAVVDGSVADEVGDDWRVEQVSDGAGDPSLPRGWWRIGGRLDQSND